MIDPLLPDPETTSAFRFMVAAMSQGLALLTLNYTLRLESRYANHRLALVGWAIVAQAIAVHQGYYWIWWLLMGANPDLMPWWKSFRYITSVATVVMALGWVLVASPYLHQLFGRYWAAGGGSFAFGLWCVGWGLAEWL